MFRTEEIWDFQKEAIFKIEEIRPDFAFRVLKRQVQLSLSCS